MRPPLSLSDRQRRFVERASLAFRSGEARDRFLASVERRLFGEPTDLAVSHAINLTLDLMEATK